MTINEIRNQETFNAYWKEIKADIAKQCEEEGYPSHGSNYDLRCEAEWEWLCESFPEYTL